MSVRVHVPGTPRPKGSKDALGRESSKYVRGWMDTIVYLTRAAAGGRRLDPPYRVDRLYLFPRPQRPKHPWPSSSDQDKLDRAVYDALTEAGVLLDDRHVIAGSEFTRFAEPGEEPGVTLEISTIDPAAPVE